MAPSRGQSRRKKGHDKGRRKTDPNKKEYKKIRTEDISFENQGWGEVAINLLMG